MLYNTANIMEDASRNLAPGPPATLKESIGSAFEEKRTHQTSLSLQAQIWQEWEDHLKHVETVPMISAARDSAMTVLVVAEV